MKLFHISDLHIGKQLHGYSLIEDQKAILEQILDQIRQEHPRALLIAGDVYDKAVPSAETVEVFDEFLTQLSRMEGLDTYLISGNHDNDKRLDFGGRILKNCHIHIAGKAPGIENPHLLWEVLEDEYGRVNLYLMPFLKPSYVRTLFPDQEIESYEDAVQAVLSSAEIDEKQRNILVAHQLFSGRGASVEESASETFRVGGQDNIDVSLFGTLFDYVALGHLHAPQKAGKECFRYSGSPLKYSISEEHQKKSITVIELKEKGQLAISVIPLKPIREVRTLRGRLEEICKDSEESCEDYVAVTLTDEEALYEPGIALKQKYPNLLFWQVDNSRTQQEIQLLEETVTLDSPLEAFADFYQKMQGVPASEEELLLVGQMIEKAGDC
ncbi:MAG: exonuclease SbcCD subunit D [Lachnospiraceae bacterium]|nr:exonuclease SbcCD subunit D [Lachnospiraceae bacterium]